MKSIIIIAFGGSTGAVLRYLISKQFNNMYPLFNFPLGTLGVNMIGAFIVGLVFSVISIYSVHNDLKLFLIVGFLGALTTYSAYSIETINLFKNNVNYAVLNILLNNVACFLMVIAGSFTFKIFNRVVR